MVGGKFAWLQTSARGVPESMFVLLTSIRATAASVIGCVGAEAWNSSRDVDDRPPGDGGCHRFGDRREDCRKASWPGHRPEDIYGLRVPRPRFTLRRDASTKNRPYR